MAVKINYFESIPVKGLDEETAKSVRMWRAVIDQAVEDLIEGSEEDKKAADFWINRRIMYDAVSPGFDDVCDLAELPIEWTKNRIQEIVEHYEEPPF